jgi:hypothetical protein
MQRWARVGVILVLALTAAFGAVYFVKAMSQLDDTADANSALNYDDREIAGGNSVIVDQTAAYEARGLIPTDGTYRFAIGPQLRGSSDLTARFSGDWLRYFLMPRRPRLDGRWVICYGCDTSMLGGPFTVRWRDENGISIGQLR